MGCHHLDAAMRCSHLRPVAIVESDASLHEALEARYGIPVSDALPVALRTSVPDCAIVATPDSTHKAVADQCLAYGLHSLVEKPLCTDPSDVSSLRTSFAEAGLVLATGLVERFNPAWTALESLRSRLGALRSIHIVRSGKPPRDLRSGPLLDLAVHDLDLLLRWDDTRSLVFEDCERDERSILLRMSQGSIPVELVASWDAPAPTRTWIVQGEHGSARADLRNHTLHWQEAGSPPMRMDTSGDDSLELEHSAFAAAVQGARVPRFPDLESHLRAIEICRNVSSMSR